MHSSARRVDYAALATRRWRALWWGSVGFDIRRESWQPAPMSPLAILASQGRVGSMGELSVR